MKLYIVGRNVSSLNDAHWTFEGVFNTRELAEAACLDRTYFVGPALLNQMLEPNIRNWPYCYYPKAM